MKTGGGHPQSTAFLIAQVGAHAATKFAERLAPLGLGPAHAGMLRIIRKNPGITQRSLSSVLGVAPSRLVGLADELEERGLVARGDSPDDRRAYALRVTEKGAETLESIGRVAREHDDALCVALSAEERKALGSLLGRVADQQGLTPGVHPGFSRLGPSRKRRAP